MKFPGMVLGYHGCDQAIADKILAGQEEIGVSTNSHDWLGSGAYFWENNPARALSWADFLSRNPRSSSRTVKCPSVIGAIIDPGNCLDLAEESSLGLVRFAHQQLALVAETAGTPLPVNEPGFRGDDDLIKRHLDCAVLNFLHEMRKSMGKPDFDTVRAPFLEGDPLFAGSKLSAKCHVQWCVRDPRRNIIAYFRPRSAGAAEC